MAFNAVAGTEYQIAVDEPPARRGPSCSHWSPRLPTTTSRLAPLSGASSITSGYNFGANKETGEPNHVYDAGGHSVWYTRMAPATGSVGITTEGSPSTRCLRSIRVDRRCLDDGRAKR